MADYDQHFKVFLTQFLDRFLLTFWPEVTPHLRLSTLRFLPLDLYMDPPAGHVRAVDVLAEVETEDHRQRTILLHVEAQRSRRPGFRRRMWEYYCLIAMRHKRPILPIALLLYETKRKSEREPWGSYSIVVAGEEIVRLRYRQIALRNLPVDDYLPGTAAVGAALGLLMERGSHWARPELYMTCIRYIMTAQERGEINPAEALLLAEMLIAYGEITDAERAAARSWAEEQADGRDIMALEQRSHLSIVAEAEERGRQEGRQEGQKEAIREIALMRFGAVPPALEARLAAATDDDLRALARLVATAASAADLR